jgi:16S rRNA (guanine527-N7)-methyltransferase
VTDRDFRVRLEARAHRAEVAVDSKLVDQLAAYYQLLRHWNQRINLTALALEPLSDDALDRLFVEPLSAARHLSELPSESWFDLGSGGGSPAIPLLLARPEMRLTMVEARERKGAFLGEVVRALNLEARVEIDRFQDVAERRASEAGLVTARAVKMDSNLSTAAGELLMSDGLLAIFASVRPEIGADFRRSGSWPLFSGGTAQLFAFRRVPRGTNGR